MDPDSVVGVTDGVVDGVECGIVAMTVDICVGVEVGMAIGAVVGVNAPSAIPPMIVASVPESTAPVTERAALPEDSLNFFRTLEEIDFCDFSDGFVGRFSCSLIR